ncbi:methyltransferase domain-containing protein [Chloroflexota bacterium]
MDTSEMLSKIKKAIKNPGRIPTHFLTLLKRAQLKRIEKDGEIFYKYKGELYPEYLNKGNAASFILDKAKQHCQGKGIDVGASNWPFPGAIPIQNEKHQNAYKLDNFSDGSLDYVFSSHCLEHLDKWQDALGLWIRKLGINGILFLYSPHESMHLWNPGGPWCGDSHKWIPTFEIINSFLIDNRMEIIEYYPEKDKYWSFHIIAKKIK